MAELEVCTNNTARMVLGLLPQVHNTTRTNQQRGLDLAAAALDNDHQTPDQDRELRYYLAGERAEAAVCVMRVEHCETQSAQQLHGVLYVGRESIPAV